MRVARSSAGPAVAAAGHFTREERLRGSNDGSLLGSRTCSAAPEMTRLAADAELHEMLAPEGAARRRDRLQRRRTRALHADARELRLERRRQPRRVGHDPLRTTLARQKRVDHLALVRLRRRPRERAEHRRQIRLRVVAEDAGLVPHRPRMQPGPLLHHHRVALVAKRALLASPPPRREHPAHRQDELLRRLHDRRGIGARRRHEHAGVVLAMVPADHAREPVRARRRTSSTGS